MEYKSLVLDGEEFYLVPKDEEKRENPIFKIDDIIHHKESKMTVKIESLTLLEYETLEGNIRFDCQNEWEKKEIGIDKDCKITKYGFQKPNHFQAEIISEQITARYYDKHYIGYVYIQHLNEIIGGHWNKDGEFYSGRANYREYNLKLKTTDANVSMKKGF